MNTCILLIYGKFYTYEGEKKSGVTISPQQKKKKQSLQVHTDYGFLYYTDLILKGEINIYQS